MAIDDDGPGLRHPPAGRRTITSRQPVSVATQLASVALGCLDQGQPGKLPRQLDDEGLGSVRYWLPAA